MKLRSIGKAAKYTLKLTALGAAALFLNLLHPLNPSPIQAVSGSNLTINYLSGVTAWGDSTAATIGDTVEFYIEIQNTTSGTTAENVSVRVDLPETPSASGVITSTAYTSSSSQTDISDSTSIVSLPTNALLQYQSGSLRVTADLDGDGSEEYNNYAWPNDNIITSGINLGGLEGGAPAVIQLSFKADVWAAIDPNLTVKFLSANPKRPGDGWSDDTQADPDDPLQFYIEIHNTAVPSVAEDLNVRVAFPTGEGTSFTPVAYIFSTSKVEDPTSITFSARAKMTYRSGSMQITWDQNGDGVYEYDGYTWPNDDLISGGGINLGALWGCNPYVIQISFWADSTEIPEIPKITINKKVVWNGNEYDSVSKETHLYDPDESMEYKIYVKNTGDEEATGVKVTDYLPAYIRTLDGADEKEFNIGTLAGGGEWSDTYTAKILSELPQNDRTQENTAKVTSDNAGSDEDTAFIWINGPEILAEEVVAAAVEVPEAPPELPVSGPTIPVTVGLASLLPLGVLLRRTAARKFLNFLR